MSRAILLPITVVALIACLPVPQTTAATLASKARKSKIHVRLIAREQPIGRTTFGYNVDSFIAELQHKNGEPELIRLSYRFLYYEPDIPLSFLDFSYVHDFHAVLDEECNSKINSVTRRYAVDGDGTVKPRTAALRYALGSPWIDENNQAVLPCYKVTPTNYTRSRRVEMHSELPKPSSR